MIHVFYNLLEIRAAKKTGSAEISSSYLVILYYLLHYWPQNLRIRPMLPHIPLLLHSTHSSQT